MEYEPLTLLWVGGLFFIGLTHGGAILDVDVYVRNLSKSTTQTELIDLFKQAGEVIAVHLVKNRKSGDSNGLAFITMSAQSEADKAISLFNSFFLDDHQLIVALVRPRGPRGPGGSY